MSLNAKENGNLKKLANFGMDALETIITKLFKNADEQSFPMPSDSAEGLDLLKNVNINSPVDGQVLTYDSDNDEWINATGGDSVSYTQTLATGEKVGEITINGTSQDINAPKYKIAVKTNLVGDKYLELSSPDSGDSSTVLASAINPSITWYQNALFDVSGDFIGSLGIDNVSFPIYVRTYIGGDGIEVNQLQTGEGQISLEYLKVVDGAVNLVFDDGN